MIKDEDLPARVNTFRHTDARGWFCEGFNQVKFDEVYGEHVTFVQDSHIKSKKNVFRGFHYQTHEKPVTKYVRVISGFIIDIVIDVRRDKDSFGTKHLFTIEEGDSLWVPPWFAHGIWSPDPSYVMYKATGYLDLECTHSICPLDPALDLPAFDKLGTILSMKDKTSGLLADTKGY